MNLLFSHYWILIAAIWCFGNGLLHDIFVLANHKKNYDRDLLRLLMDGHVLILSGAVYFVCFFMLQARLSYGAIIGIIIAIGMLIYCAMIFPFLKSFATMGINLMVIVVCIHALKILPGVFHHDKII